MCTNVYVKTKAKIFDSLLSIYFFVVRTTGLDYINKLDPTVKKAGRSDELITYLNLH